MEIKTSASLNIEGFVEAIVDNKIYGWVNFDISQLSLSAVLNGSIIGKADEFLSRADLALKPLAKGFSIKCDTPVAPGDLATGRLQVIAICDESTSLLPVWLPLKEAGNFLNINLPDLKKGWDFVPIESKKKFAQEFGGAQGGREFGRISTDGVVQAGRNGYLFLLSGSNHLAKFYTDELNLDLESWITCFHRRNEIAIGLGIRYIQVMIPEKSSVYYEYAPFTAAAGSVPYLNLIDLALNNNAPICDVLPDLLRAKDDRPVYLQGDTHLSTFGAEIVARRILQDLGETVNLDPPKVTKVLRIGDLNERYSDDGDVSELISIYEKLFFENVEGDIELISSVDPETGHQATRRAWRNNTAPLKKKVLCFGGSSFERGDYSGNLSWWFARLFSEFHFIWSPDLDIDYVKTISPDIVICQSIERFITQPPAN